MSSRFVDVVVAGLHLRWDGVWQRPNHLLSRAARVARVVVLEEPVASERDEDVITARGTISIVTPHRRARPADVTDARSLATVRALCGDGRALVWLYTPMMLALADAFPGAPLIYDKMDELAQFAGADVRLRPREEALLARGDFVFTGGRSLYGSIATRARRAACYPSGVELEHFGRARAVAPHPALAARRKPVFTYVGVIDERLDLALIESVALTYPMATIAMVGPVAKIETSSLPQRPNIVYLGKRTYQELPAILAATDVAMMPFALSSHTAYISPTKTLEYLAGGVPVVSTAIPDVVAEYREIVHIAGDSKEFVAMLDRARVPDARRARSAREKLRSAGWDAIWAAMSRDLTIAGIDLPAAPAA